MKLTIYVNDKLDLAPSERCGDWVQHWLKHIKSLVSLQRDAGGGDGYAVRGGRVKSGGAPTAESQTKPKRNGNPGRRRHGKR